MRQILIIGTAIALTLPPGIAAAAGAGGTTALTEATIAGAVPALPVAWQDRHAGAGSRFDAAIDVASDPASGRVFVTGQLETGESVQLLTRAYDADGALLWSVAAAGARILPGALSVDSERSQILISGRVTAGDGSSDLITLAYDMDGNERWRVSYAAEAGRDEYPRDNGVDPDTGTVYVTGYIGQNCCTFQTDPLTQAIDSDGAVLWTRRYGVAGEDEGATALAVTPGGGVYVAGNQGDVFDKDAFTLAYDRRGQVRWTQVETDEGFGRNADVAADPAGDRVYVTGTRSTPGNEAVVVSLSASDGLMIWKRNLHVVPGGSASGLYLAVDPRGRGVYTTGTRQLSVLGLIPRQQFAESLTRTGAEVWQRMLPAADTRETAPVGIVVDPVTGIVYVAGSIDDLLISEVQDILVFGYGRNGRPVSVNRFDGGLGLNDDPTAVAIDPTARRLYVRALADAAEPDDFDYLTVAFALPPA